MVEVGAKPETARVAVASGSVKMAAATLEQVQQGAIGKGNVLEVARIAAIAGLKRTAELIPLCHPLRITGVEVEFSLQPELRSIKIIVSVHAHDRTGVEMEALTGVAVAALTIYDMVKAVDRGVRIESIQLEQKQGGKSGTWRRETDAG